MKNRAVHYGILFVFCGISLALLFAYAERKTSRIYEENLPYSRLGEHLRSRVIAAQLAFEQYENGNNAVSFETEVSGKLASAISLLNNAYEGKPSELGDFVRSADDELRALIKESILDLEKLNQVTATQRAASATADSATVASRRAEGRNAVAFQFAESMASLDRLALYAEQEFQNERRALALYFWVPIVLLVLVFAGLGFLMYRLRHSSERLVADNDRRMEEQSRSAQALSSFIEAVSAGNFSVELELESGNNLGKTLISMRDKLRDNAESDRKRNWSTSGLAQIGEILRSNTTTTTELYDNIIRFVVRYTRSNQGGLFLLDEENTSEKELELVACYAFERKKFLRKKVAVGEGLIGQSFLEGEKIYLLEVPQEYITITSGLGGANPNALLIVPLKVNGIMYGVLELATFGQYAPHEIELVEKFAETIASTISNVRINDSTRILLEKTQQQAEEMRAQEEEMRQNMEELEATQEEMRRKEKHIQEMLDREKQRNESNNRNRQLVMDLGKSPEVLEGNWDRTVENVARLIGERTGVTRAGIWRYDAGENRLTGARIFHVSLRELEPGRDFSALNYPGFVNAVLASRVVRATDVAKTPEVRDLLDDYCGPLQIRSMLVVPYFSEGKVAGMINCEHQHESMEWSDDHVEFLLSCADLLTVTLNTVRIRKMVTTMAESQETLQTIIDNLPRAVFWKDRELKIQGCNQIFARVAGLSSPAQLIGKTDYELPWKDHAEAYRADDLEVMNSRRSRIDQEERNVNSDGVESWVLTSKVAIIGPEGQAVAVLGMFEDITERKRREEEVSAKLRELDELKGILETTKN